MASWLIFFCFWATCWQGRCKRTWRSIWCWRRMDPKTRSLWSRSALKFSTSYQQVSCIGRTSMLFLFFSKFSVSWAFSSRLPVDRVCILCRTWSTFPAFTWRSLTLTLIFLGGSVQSCLDENLEAWKQVKREIPGFRSCAYQSPTRLPCKVFKNPFFPNFWPRPQGLCSRPNSSSAHRTAIWAPSSRPYHFRRPLNSEKMKVFVSFGCRFPPLPCILAGLALATPYG